MVKEKTDNALDKNPKVKTVVDTAAKVVPKVINAIKDVTQQKDTGDKIKSVADSVSSIVDSISSKAQISEGFTPQKEQFPEDFDIQNELNMDQ